MESLTLIVAANVGLHARPAALFVAEAGRYQADIQVRNATTESLWVDAKSILSVLTLGVEQGHAIDIAIKGVDEKDAAEALADLVRSDFEQRDTH